MRQITNDYTEEALISEFKADLKELLSKWDAYIDLENPGPYGAPRIELRIEVQDKEKYRVLLVDLGNQIYADGL